MEDESGVRLSNRTQTTCHLLPQVPHAYKANTNKRIKNVNTGYSDWMTSP